MKALVTGCGRGGTNLVCEYVRATEAFEFTKAVEDRKFFNHKELPEGYGTKLATEHKGFTLQAIEDVLERDSDLHIFFALRHPADACLSKVYRGRPLSDGGGCNVYSRDAVPPDGTVNGAIKAVRHMANIYEGLQASWGYRVHAVRMEDLIQHPEWTCRDICSIAGVQYTEAIRDAWQNNRNEEQRKRYKGLDTSQIDMYQEAHTIYDGYFANRQADVDKIIDACISLADVMGYGE